MDTAEAGRIGGFKRAKQLTPEQRKAIALKASRAAAKARSEKARLRKSKQLHPVSNLAAALKKSQKRKRNRNRPLSDLAAEIRKAR